MLSRLLAILLSSWVTTPLVMLYAQAHQFANIEVVQLILLTLAAQTPLLLLFNECVTPAYLKYRSTVPPLLIGGTLVIQAATIHAALVFSGRSATAPDVLIATALATWSSWITLIQAQKVMASALGQQLTFRRSFALGVIPSMSLLLVYVIYQHALGDAFPGFLFLHLIVPALVYQTISGKLPAPTEQLPPPDQRLLRLTLIAGLIILLLTAINVKIRAELGATVPHYNSLILAALNVASALFLTFSKVAHLQNQVKEMPPFSPRSLLPATVISTLIVFMPKTTEPSIAILKFLLLQFALVHALIQLRSIWQPSTSLQCTQRP